MTYKEFNKSIEHQLDFSKALMGKKGEEYAENAEKMLTNDRLSHFKKAAALQGISQKQAIFGMLSKHIVSLSDMVASNNKYPVERWEEKITDSINYLLILKAAVDEENKEREEK